MRKPTKLQEAKAALENAKKENERLSFMVNQALREIEDMHVVFDAISGSATRQSKDPNAYNRKGLTLVQRAALISILNRMATS